MNDTNNDGVSTSQSNPKRDLLIAPNSADFKTKNGLQTKFKKSNIPILSNLHAKRMQQKLSAQLLKKQSQQTLPSYNEDNNIMVSTNEASSNVQTIQDQNTIANGEDNGLLYRNKSVDY